MRLHAFIRNIISNKNSVLLAGHLNCFRRDVWSCSKYHELAWWLRKSKLDNFFLSFLLPFPPCFIGVLVFYLDPLCTVWMNNYNFKCEQIIASENQPVRWTTPLGLPVVQPYRKFGRHLVSFANWVNKGHQYSYDTTKSKGYIKLLILFLNCCRLRLPFKFWHYNEKQKRYLSLWWSRLICFKCHLVLLSSSHSSPHHHK